MLLPLSTLVLASQLQLQPGLQRLAARCSHPLYRSGLTSLWFHLDQKFTGSGILSPTAPKPTAVYQFKDQDTVSFNVRAQRNF